MREKIDRRVNKHRVHNFFLKKKSVLFLVCLCAVLSLSSSTTRTSLTGIKCQKNTGCSFCCPRCCCCCSSFCTRAGSVVCLSLEEEGSHYKLREGGLLCTHCFVSPQSGLWWRVPLEGATKQKRKRERNEHSPLLSHTRSPYKGSTPRCCMHTTHTELRALW